MAARHKKHKASGGVALKNDAPSEVYAGAGSNVLKEAREEHKRGGKTMGHAHGGKAKMRMDRRPGRKRGGGVGSNMKPLSTAATVAKQNTVSNQDSEAG